MQSTKLLKRLGYFPLIFFHVFASHSICTAQPLEHPRSNLSSDTMHRRIAVNGIELFYREAGPIDAPTIVLLHGFPASSHMFRDLIPKLSGDFHLIAPDYPGFGSSGMPDRSEFNYSFDGLANIVDQFLSELKLDSFWLYVQDYGAPIGYRIASKHPEKVLGFVVQNGNAYAEGIDNEFWVPIKEYWQEPSNLDKREALRDFLKFEATKWQYTHGVPPERQISPDGPIHDQFLLDRKGNQEIQLDLFLSYGSNPPLYSDWQAYFRMHRPPMLIVWGKNDAIFPASGAIPYQRDLPDAELYLLDAGHFALESHCDEIATHMKEFIRNSDTHRSKNR